MSKIKSPGYTDTATTATQLDRGPLNFGADFRVSRDSGNALTLVNITSPFDRTEEIMMNFSQVANIYEKTSIDPSVYAPNKRGVTLYSKLSDTYQITDSTDASFVQHLPVSASLTIRSIQSEYITAEDVCTVIARLVSTFFDTGSETYIRLNAALRGSLKPSDL